MNGRLSGVAKIVYTDGACSPNPGAGGWGWWVNDSEYGSGADPQSTNNVMELRAVIEALKAQPADQFIEVHSDSKYVTDCFNQRWYVGWRKNGWKTSKGGPVQNRETWEELLSVLDARTANTKWVYVKGHAGNVGNEKADSLAVAARLGITHTASDPTSAAMPDGPAAPSPADVEGVLTVDGARSLLERAIGERGKAYVYEPPAGVDGFAYFDSDGKPSCLIGHLLHYLDFGPGDVPEGSNVWLGMRDLFPAAAGVMEGLDAAQARQDEGWSWGDALAAFDAGVALVGSAT